MQWCCQEHTNGFSKLFLRQQCISRKSQIDLSGSEKEYSVLPFNLSITSLLSKENRCQFLISVIHGLAFLGSNSLSGVAFFQSHASDCASLHIKT